MGQQYLKKSKTSSLKEPCSLIGGEDRNAITNSDTHKKISKKKQNNAPIFIKNEEILLNLIAELIVGIIMEDEE